MNQDASLIYEGESFLGSKIQSDINFQPVWNLKTSVDCPPGFCFQIKHHLKFPQQTLQFPFYFLSKPCIHRLLGTGILPHRENKQQPLKVRTCLYCADVPAKTHLGRWIDFRDVCFICQLQTHSKSAFNKDLEGDLDMAPNLQYFIQNDLENFLTIKLFRITQSPVLTDTFANSPVQKPIKT